MKKRHFNKSSSTVAILPVDKNLIKVGANRSLKLMLMVIFIVAIVVLALCIFSVPGQTATVAGGGSHSLALDFDGTVIDQLTGSIPSQLGNLDNLEKLYLQNNELWGEIPGELMNLVALTFLDICNNHLYTNDPDLRDFLNSIQQGGDWISCQTPPFIRAMSWTLLLLLDN